MKKKQVRQRESRIPPFKTIEEEAEFWDTHDTTEFENEFETVHNVKFIPHRPLKKGMTVRLDQKTFIGLARRARQKGVRPSTLTRMWIIEQLHGARRETPTKS